jgi:mannose-6-phosphate isomerase-like protein (cupin superfamily)
MTPQNHRPIPPLGHRAEHPDATAPDGSEIRFLIDHRHHAQGASVVEATLPPGQVSRSVWHRSVEEVWYILEGCGQVWRCPPDAGPSPVESVAVKPGDALTLPTGWRFQFSASPAGPLRFLCITIPPWPGPDEARPAEIGGLGTATITGAMTGAITATIPTDKCD